MPHTMKPLLAVTSKERPHFANRECLALNLHYTEPLMASSYSKD